jgi:4a-hydroxytetrahydrobiopterin dehydratase
LTVLTQHEIRQVLGELDGWQPAGAATDDVGEIGKQFAFADFREAVAFVVRVAFEAEAANHHPDLDLRYSKVQVTLSTHSEGGVTEKDVALARAINAVGNR